NAACLSVVSRLAFTAALHAGSSGSSSVRAAASMRSSSGSRAVMIALPRSHGRMWNRREQIAGVVRLRSRHHIFGPALLDDPTGLHNDDTVAEQPYNVEVVRNEEIAHAD